MCFLCGRKYTRLYLYKKTNNVRFYNLYSLFRILHVLKVEIQFFWVIIFFFVLPKHTSWKKPSTRKWLFFYCYYRVPPPLPKKKKGAQQIFGGIVPLFTVYVQIFNVNCLVHLLGDERVPSMRSRWNTWQHTRKRNIFFFRPSAFSTACILILKVFFFF